jgi:hypothetical protein
MKLGRKLGWGMGRRRGWGMVMERGWGMVMERRREVRSVGCGGLMVLLWSGAKRDVGGGR